MKESAAKLMVAVCDQVVFIKINGRADFHLAMDLKNLFLELQPRGFRRFVLEVGQCCMMDSTFSGSLADIVTKFRDPAKPNEFPLELINPTARVAETLENLGMAESFKITYCPEGQGVDYQSLPKTAENSKVDIARNCLEAHTTLMGLNPSNLLKFKDVAQFLAEDLKRLELAEKK